MIKGQKLREALGQGGEKKKMDSFLIASDKGSFVGDNNQKSQKKI